jgi:transcriptional regulator with XRE-family HTH domain/quercetin dioxygenase-like cupin family protein
VVELGGDPVNELGPRLKAERLRSGLSLREVARRLGVSPSFVSQMENGKSQPSVATLYSLTQLLGLSIDELFAQDGEAEAGSDEVTAPTELTVDEGANETSRATTRTVSRSDFGSPSDAWEQDGSTARFVLVRPETRPRLVMDSGVIWEQLATNGDGNLDFMEIIYPPGSSSTNDSRMLRHQGIEYGYLLSGELEITYGFDTYTLKAGESMALDSTVPHLLTNHGDEPARGIWAVHHCAEQSMRSE